jgi:hypothetical protein
MIEEAKRPQKALPIQLSYGMSRAIPNSQGLQCLL